jgi:hypothetical protein
LSHLGRVDDPFAEEFAEEEIVLDNFAAWDQVFHSGTTRVENRRDHDLTTLVQFAAEAWSSACPPPVGRDLEDVDLEPDAAGFLPEENTPPSIAIGVTWPRLRLADVADLAAKELPYQSASNAPMATPPARFANDPGGQKPILIVEDDSSGGLSSPAVRRVSYQHLFSRLRSG